MNILLIQGANMEYLGRREPEHYGTTTAEDLDRMLMDEADRREIRLDIRYTNLEGEAIGWILSGGSRRRRRIGDEPRWLRLRRVCPT